MKVVKTTKGVDILIFGSGKELTADRYSEFQKYLALQSGIGGSIEDINTRFSRVEAFIDECKWEDVKREVVNTKQAILAVKNGVGYYTLAFACLVVEIGGRQADDLSMEGLQATCEKLRTLGITQKAIEESVEEVKKKFQEKSNLFFQILSKLRKFFSITRE